MPTNWKMSVITPVHKSGPTANPLNYRPIALTCVLCKQLEHIIARHIRDHLDRNNFFADEQHGFRAHRSCESQLIVTLHQIANYIDQGVTVDAIILDFSKAFDTVCHSKLLQKLNLLGLPPQIINWIKHWLTGRHQTVKVLGSTSHPIEVLSGVPQGSVLGPLLFNIYINDILQCINNPNSLRLFADDALLLGPRKSDGSSPIQADLDRLVAWANTWQMKFNVKKCQVISFSSTSNYNKIEFRLADTVLYTANFVKYLGVYIDHKLDWSTHVKYVCNKSNQTLNMLRRSLKGSKTPARLTVYKTLVRPVLEYASCAWSPYKQGHIQSLEKIQRKAVRWIENLKRTDSVTQAIEQLSLDPLLKRRTNKDKLAYLHMLDGAIDIEVDKYIPRNLQHNTRRNIIHYTTNTSTFANSFFPRVTRSLTA